MQNSPAQRYCLNRGWSEDVQTAYQLGYLDLHSKDLADMGGEQAFRELGLLYRTGHPWLSRRLLIPLFDPFGVVVALATRVLGPTDGARYINSRRTEIFPA